MKALVQMKGRAIELRKKGLSYKDILTEIKASKSSLSLWLRDLPLTPLEKKYLKERQDSNISRGRIKVASVLHENRLQRDRGLFAVTKQEFDAHKDDSLYVIGIALYWAEGSRRSSTFSFTNSDPDMINVMLLWIERFWFTSRKNIKVRLYIHKPYAHENCEQKWSEKISVPLANFQKTIYKPTSRLVKKRPDYVGCLRIELGKTTNLRKMQFLQNLLLDHIRFKE